MILSYKNGKGDKIHISIDGEYSFTVDKAYFMLLGLSQNMSIDEQELESLSKQIENRRAYNQAVSYLSRRDHSEKELLLKLRQKGYAESGVDAVERLKRSGYIDDERFARMFARELVNLKKYGKSRIRQELFRKGISSETVNLVLEDEDFCQSDIKEILQKKYIRYLNDEKGVKKAVNGLLRMGYSFGEIKAAIADFCEESFDTEVYDE